MSCGNYQFGPNTTTTQLPEQHHNNPRVNQQRGRPWRLHDFDGMSGNARYKKNICKAGANGATTKTTLFAQPQRQHCNDTIVNFSVTKSQALGYAPARFATDFCTLFYNPFSIAWCFIVAKSAISAKSVAASANVLPILDVYWTEIAEFCAIRCNQRWS